MARELLGIATDAEVPYAVRLAAVRDALDRAGVVGPRTLDVAIGPAPWMSVFDAIESGPRSVSRARRGHPEGEGPDEVPEWVQAALEAAQSSVEVIDAEPEPTPATPTPRRRYPAPITGLDAITEAARVRAASAR